MLYLFSQSLILKSSKKLPQTGHGIQQAALAGARRAHDRRQIAILEHAADAIQQRFVLCLADCVGTENLSTLLYYKVSLNFCQTRCLTETGAQLDGVHDVLEFNVFRHAAAGITLYQRCFLGFGNAGVAAKL